MSWLSTLGGDLSDLFTGRWTGGQTNLASDNLTPLAEVGGALALGGVGLGALGAGAGAAEAGVGALGATEAAGAGGGGALADLGLSASPDALSAFGAASPADLSAAGGDAVSGWGMGDPAFGPAATGGGTSLDTLALGGADASSPMSLSPSLTGGGGAPGAAGGNWWDTLTSPSQWSLGGVGKAAGIGAAGLGLGMNLLKGSSPSANQNQMSNIAGFGSQQAGALTAEGAQLRQYLENGTLPPAQQAAVTQAIAAEKARLIANAGKNGVSTDPTQNTALSQDLAAADRNGLILAGQMEQQLFTAGQNLLNSGLNAAGLSGQLYTALANMDRTDTANLNSAIANFAAALGGGGAKGQALTIKAG